MKLMSPVVAGSKEIAPSAVIAPIPVMSPAALMSQSEESRVKVSPLSPMVKAAEGLILPPEITKSPLTVTSALVPTSSIVNKVFVPSVTSSWPSEAVSTKATAESANEISRSQPEPTLKAVSTAFVPLTPSISIPIKLSPDDPPTGSKSTLIPETVLFVPSAPSILT